MKLIEMGIIGHQVKITSDAPDHAGEIGRIVSASAERVYVEFADGKKSWVANRYIVGTRKAESLEDGDDYPLMEMAAKKHCEKCGKTMAANHFWYKGGWRCKKTSRSDDTEDQSKESTDKFPEMSDDDYGKLSKEDRAAQDRKEKEWYERNGRTGPQDHKAKDANEEAANKRAAALANSLSKQVAKK